MRTWCTVHAEEALTIGRVVGDVQSCVTINKCTGGVWLTQVVRVEAGRVARSDVEV